MKRNDWAAVLLIAVTAPLSVLGFLAAIEIGFQVQHLPSPPTITDYLNPLAAAPTAEDYDNSDRRERLRLNGLAG